MSQWIVTLILIAITVVYFFAPSLVGIQQSEVATVLIVIAHVVNAIYAVARHLGERA